MENHAKKTLFEIFPERFNKSDYEKTSLEHIVVILKECFNDLKKNETSKISERTKLMHTHSHAPEKSHHVHPRTRKRRAAGGNHQHSFHDEEKSINHHILHELTHAFHLGSMVILTVLLVEVKKTQHIVIAFHPSSQILQPITPQTLIPGNDLNSMCYPSVIPIVTSSISTPPPPRKNKRNTPRPLSNFTDP